MDNIFEEMDFGPLKQYLDNDDVTDISYSNGGQVWLKTLSKGVYRVENSALNNAFMEAAAESGCARGAAGHYAARYRRL